MTFRNQRYLTSFSTQANRLRLLPLTTLAFILFLIGFSFLGGSRAFQTPAAISSLSAASFETNLTPEGIAAGFGSNLAPSTAAATTTPLPTTLNTISVTVNGVNASLFFVSSGQINYLIPLGAAAGEATVNVLRNGVITHTGKVNVVSAAPAIFTANANGAGVPAAIALRVATNGAQTTETISQLVNNRWQTKAINLGPTGERVFLILFLCGIRNLPNSDGNSGNGVAENVRVLIGGVEQTPIFANKQGGLVGVDQINVEIPRELLGRGKIKATVLGGGFSSLEVEIEIAGATGTNPPTVTSFAPALATASETLNISGTGFSTVAANNLVRVNGLEALVESASASQLIVRVPYGAEAGRVAVRTTQGEGSSNNDVGVRTTISGLATDTNGNPLPGIEVSYGTIKTTTRNDGTYLLRDVPAGLGTLKLDPSKLPLNPPMQPYSKIAGVTLNRDNLQSTTALQTVSGEGASIQTSTGGAVEAGEFTQHRLLAPAGTITTGNVTFTFADNTVGTFPAGATDGRIHLTVLNNSRTPAPLPAGIFSSTIAMLSPFGVKLAPGGKLTFPNTDGLAANAQARLYKLDQTTGSPTLGQFIDVGVATVSADGQRVETGANAITETSIYFAALARPLTTVTGRVVDSDNTTPVRRALVILRGQQTFTDGNGSFTLRNIPVPANNLLSIEASFVRPTGRTDSVTRNNIAAVVNGLTSVKPDLVLPSPATQPNRPPTLTAPTLLTATEGQIRNIPILVSDPDSTQPVQVTLTSPNFVSIVLIQNVANIRIAPPAGSAGTYPLTIRATDNLNASTTVNATLTVTDNRAPVLIVPLAQTASVGQQLAFNVSASDPDAEQTVTLGAASLPSGATFTQTSATTGRFTWTPTANQTGNFTATFTATDNGSPSLSDRKSVVINVGGITGAQWTQTAGPEGATVRAFVVNGTNVFAATDGGIFRSTNDGASWTPASNGLAGQFISSLANNGTALFAGSYGVNQLTGAGVFRSTDNGATWTPANNGLSSQNILSLGTSGSTVFAGAVAGGAFRSTDNGANWTNASNGLGTQRVNAFAALGNNVFAGTLTGGVFRSTDNGATWTPANTGLLIPSIGSLAVSGTTLFAGTNGGGVFRSTDNGATWAPANNGLGIQVVTSLFVNGTTIFAGSLNGGVYRSTDNGATWASASNGLAQQPISALTARGSAWLAGTFIGVFRSTDNGVNWAPANTNLSGQNILALAVNGANLFAGTINGVFRTTNNGANWTAVNNGLTSPIVLSLLVVNGTVYAGTEGNGVYRTTDNGANWTAANTGLQEQGVTALANIGTTLYAATADAGVFRSTNGTSWTAINTGLGSQHVLALVASGNTLFAGTEQAGIYRSTDGGNTWAAASTGLTTPVVFSLGVNGTTIFAGTASGLFRSIDNGATWALANTGLSAVIVASFATNGQSLFIGTGFGGVYRSVNNGGLWTPFNEGLTNPFVKSLVVNGNSLAAGTIGSSVFTRPLP